MIPPDPVSSARHADVLDAFHSVSGYGQSDVGVALRAGAAALRAKSAVHAKFGFVKGADGKCACAYCTGDAEALAEACADYEMKNHTLTQQLAALRTPAPSLPEEIEKLLAYWETTKFGDKGLRLMAERTATALRAEVTARQQAEQERDTYRTLAGVGVWHADCRPNRHMAARAGVDVKPKRRWWAPWSERAKRRAGTVQALSHHSVTPSASASAEKDTLKSDPEPPHVS